jgi:hypothetical protein
MGDAGSDTTVSPRGAKVLETAVLLVLRVLRTPEERSNPAVFAPFWPIRLGNLRRLGNFCAKPRRCWLFWHFRPAATPSIGKPGK